MSGPVPARVDGTAKAALLSLIDDAVDAGWTLNRACAVVELDRGRAWRWQQRRAGGGLDDARPGGNPIHGLLECEEAEILALFDEWGDVDRSHRELAHRGSYEQRVWASPSTVDRVLARHGLALQGAPRPARTVKTPWPHWCERRPNQLWCWDGSQFERCVAAKHAYAIADLVSRKWISTHLTANPDSVAARVLFSRGLDNEGLLTDELRARLADPDTGLPDGDQAPLLLAVSDNGTEMHANETRRFMALCSIARHFGRPSTPTDQAWIESLWGHVKREHPHLTTITDPAVLAAELERVRVPTTTASGCTKRSAASPPTTNTTAAATPSAQPAPTACETPTNNAEPGTGASDEPADCPHQPQPASDHRMRPGIPTRSVAKSQIHLRRDATPRLPSHGRSRPLDAPTTSRERSPSKLRPAPTKQAHHRFNSPDSIQQPGSRTPPQPSAPTAAGDRPPCRLRTLSYDRSTQNQPRPINRTHHSLTPTAHQPLQPYGPKHAQCEITMRPTCAQPSAHAAPPGSPVTPPTTRTPRCHHPRQPEPCRLAARRHSLRLTRRHDLSATPTGPHIRVGGFRLRATVRNCVTGGQRIPHN